MKRLLVLLSILGATACSEQTRTALPGGVSQPGALAVSGGRVFVTSPEANSLRVLNLGLDGGQREFVRAPNPMFPLQIPAVRRPTQVVAVTRGTEGRLIAVASAYDGQIRLVDGDGLVPVGRPIPLPAPAVQVALHPAGDRLVVVTDAPVGEALPGVVREITLDPAVLADPSSVTEEDTVVAAVRDLPVDALPGGLALTEAAGSPEAWVSDVRTAELVRVDLASGAQVRLPSGRILGRLSSSPAYSDGTEEIPAGVFVFGVSKESPEIMGFDVVEGTIDPKLTYGEQLLPIPLPSLASAAVPVANALVPRTSEFSRTNARVPVPLLLLVPLLDGGVAYVSGDRMQPVDLDADFDVEPEVTVSPEVSNRGEDGTYDGTPDPSAPIINTRGAVSGSAPLEALVTVTPGVTRSRTWKVAWKVELPRQTSVTGRLVEGTPGAVEAIFAPEDLAERVLPGDRLEVTGPEVDAGTVEACAGYEAEEGATTGWQVVSVSEGTIVLEAEAEGAPLPTAECFPDTFRYTVRSGGFAVWAEDLTPVWRLAPGETFLYEGERYLKTSPVFLGPDVRFTLVADQPTESWEPGVTRTLKVDGGAEPRTMTVDVQMRDPRDPFGQAILGGGHLPGLLDVAGPEDGLDALTAFVPFEHGDNAPGFVISFPVHSPDSQDVDL